MGHEAHLENAHVEGIGVLALNVGAAHIGRDLAVLLHGEQRCDAQVWAHRVSAIREQRAQVVHLPRHTRHESYQLNVQQELKLTKINPCAPRVATDACLLLSGTRYCQMHTVFIARIADHRLLAERCAVAVLICNGRHGSKERRREDTHARQMLFFG
jgi:hypothetical protein